MKLLVDINHPGHVHFFRNIIEKMRNAGHEIIVTASEKDNCTGLLREYDLEFIHLGSYGKAFLTKLANIPVMAGKMTKVVKKHCPDALMGIASSRIAHAGWLLNKPSFIFTDTEHATESIALFKPFATKIITPHCFTKELGKKHIRYQGFHELAYLHPSTFSPDPSVLAELDLSQKDKFFILRFVSWDATHDIGKTGFSMKVKRKIVNFLNTKGTVIISAENEIPSEFEEYRYSVSPTKMHDLLYYATMYIGEGGTMASEAALLGTPSVLVTTLTAGANEMLERHNLLKKPSNEEIAFETIVELLKKDNLKDEWRENLKQYDINDMDVSRWMFNYFENL